MSDTNLTPPPPDTPPPDTTAPAKADTALTEQSSNLSDVFKALWAAVVEPNDATIQTAKDDVDAWWKNHIAPDKKLGFRE